MENVDQTSIGSKAAFFSQLGSLSHNDHANDDFDAREETQRALHRRFFRPAPASLPQEQRGQTPPAKPNRLQNLTPRRIIAAPRPASGTVIKGTGPGKPRPKGRLGALLDGGGADVVRETPVAAAGTPSLKRSLGSGASEESSSPSANVKAGMSTRTTNKRGRVSGPKKPRPEVDQIFKGLAFFYVPDNDIAPARRLRINRAREFGAAWTRDLTTATHVIVEKKLDYKDVERIWPKDEGAFGGREPPKVVNEDYPLDCIQFRAIVDPSQRKYLLNGQAEAAAAKEDDVTSAAADAGEQTKARVGSLQLKPQHHNKGRWDYVPPRGTPSQGDESTNGPTTERVTETVAVDSQPVVLDLAEAGEPLRDTPKDNGPGGNEAPSAKDELSDYILMMQEFKDLPLDVDEDDDAQSTINEDIDQHSGSENESQQKRRSSRRLRPTSKAIAFEDRFACNRAGRKDANEDNPNARTIEILQKMNGYYERVNDHWRTLAYRKAIGTLKQQSVKITTEDEAYRLPNIGHRLAQKIEEIVTTDRLKKLEHAEEDPTDHALQTFLKIYGVGNKVAAQWIAQGWRTLDDVKQHVKLTASQAVGVAHYDDLNTRIPRKEVTALGEIVSRAAARIDPAVQLIIGGSYRRGAESSHDIDLIVTKPGTALVADLQSFLHGLLDRLERDKFLVARLASSRAGSDGSKWHGCCVLPRIRGLNDKKQKGEGEGEYRPVWRRIDFLLVPETQLGAALIYFTGNDIFNRSIRLLASKKGMRLNQRGLYRNALRGPNRVKVTEGELVESRDERRIFEILGVQWREPWERWC